MGLTLRHGELLCRQHRVSCHTVRCVHNTLQHRLIYYNMHQCPILYSCQRSLTHSELGRAAPEVKHQAALTPHTPADREKLVQAAGGSFESQLALLDTFNKAKDDKYDGQTRTGMLTSTDCCSRGVRRWC